MEHHQTIQRVFQRPYIDRKPQSRTEEVNGKVMAYVVDQQPTKLLTELPGEPVAGSLRSWIPRNDADPLSQAAEKLLEFHGAGN